jgi:hypothetical protein
MAGRDLVDWANTAPRADLAAELMAAFGGEGARRVGLRCEEIEGWLLGRSPNSFTTGRGSVNIVTHIGAPLSWAWPP